MRTRRLLCLAAAFLFLQAARGESTHTPKPGSAERQAICDGARAFVVSKYATGSLPQAIVFKISHLSVQADYCNIEAIPLFKDGSYIGQEYMADIAFNLCLQRAGGSWKVFADLSRTDVPEAAEIATIRRKLPAGFPLALLSPTWRQLLSGSRVVD